MNMTPIAKIILHAIGLAIALILSIATGRLIEIKVPQDKKKTKMWAAGIFIICAILSQAIVAVLLDQLGEAKEDQLINSITEMQQQIDDLSISLADAEKELLNQGIIYLPGRHTPPNSVGGAQPNTETNFPTNMNQASQIKIPGLNLDERIVQGDGWEDLKKGIGQKIGTVNPGESGIIVLSAYNDIFGEKFRYLEQLSQGDKINLFSNTGNKFEYIVENIDFSDELAYKLEYPPSESVLVLTSQYPYLVDDQFIIVTAYLADE